MRTVKAELGQHQKGSFPIAGRARLGRGRNVYATRRKQTLPVYEHGSARGDGDVSHFGFLAPNGLAKEGAVLEQWKNRADSIRGGWE